MRVLHQIMIWVSVFLLYNHLKWEIAGPRIKIWFKKYRIWWKTAYKTSPQKFLFSVCGVCYVCSRSLSQTLASRQSRWYEIISPLSSETKFYLFAFATNHYIQSKSPNSLGLPNWSTWSINSEYQTLSNSIKIIPYNQQTWSIGLRDLALSF